MTLVRWNPQMFESPFRMIQTMQEDLNRFMDDWPWLLPGAQRGGLTTGAFIPPMDMYDHADKLVVRVDVPGLKKDDIEVSVVRDTLTLRGEKKVEETQGRTHSERFYGSFSRSVTLPVGVDSDQVTAKYQDGVLEVVLPKRQESKPRQIAVNA